MMHLSIHKVGQINEADLKFVVICVKHKEQWLLVRHKERTTWEMAGGHIDTGENAHAAAIRELYEETGIIKETIAAVCDYKVSNGDGASFGRLFYVDAEEPSELPCFEIAEVRLFHDFPESSTYPQIYKVLTPQIKEYENTQKVLLAKEIESIRV